MNKQTTGNYQSGNLGKYESKNPLKKWMLVRYYNKLSYIIDNNFGVNSIKTMLDVGCGEGFTTRFFKEKLGQVSIKGMDFEHTAIEAAKNMSSPDIHYSQGDIYTLGKQGENYDVVSCLEVLEHLEYPEKALDILTGICKNYLIISVPNEPYFRIGNLLSMKNISQLGNPIDHIQHWTHAGFKSMISGHFNECKFYKSFPWSIAVIKPHTNRC